MFVLWSEEYDLNAHPGYYWQIIAHHGYYWQINAHPHVLLTNLRILGIRGKSILLGRRSFQTPPLRTWPRHRRLSQGSVCWAPLECASGVLCDSVRSRLLSKVSLCLEFCQNFVQWTNDAHVFTSRLSLSVKCERWQRLHNARLFWFKNLLHHISL